MSQLPVISGRDAVKAFGKAGFETVKARGKGSHIVMAKAGIRASSLSPTTANSIGERCGRSFGRPG